MEGEPDLVVTRDWEPDRDVLKKITNAAGQTVRSSYDYSVVSNGVNSLGQRTGVRTTFDLGAGTTANPGDTSWGYDTLSPGQAIKNHSNWSVDSQHGY